MNELAIVENLLPIGKGKLTPTSLELNEKLTVEEWIKIGKRLTQCEAAFQWWIGDWWAFGQHKWGERRAIVESEDWPGPTFETCANYASTCRKFKTSLRSELLSFRHHREVASIENEALRKSLLDWCEAPLKDGTKKPRSIRELREEIVKRYNKTEAEHALQRIDELLDQYKNYKTVEEIEDARKQILLKLQETIEGHNQKKQKIDIQELNAANTELVVVLLGEPASNMKDYLSFTECARKLVEEREIDFRELVKVQITEFVSDDLKLCKKALVNFQEFVKALEARNA